MIRLGIETDTGDREGNVKQEKIVDLKHMEKEYVEEVLRKFLGKQKQVPPIYSAIKVKRKKAI